MDLSAQRKTRSKSKDPVLLTIDDQDFTVAEFMYGYKKNNVKGAVMDQKSLDDYLELFINFRLKVKEAEDLLCLISIVNLWAIALNLINLT